MGVQQRKNAVVTGGTDGIGRAVAVELARRNWSVTIVGRSEEKGAATLARMRELSAGDHRFFARDFSRMADVVSAADELRQGFGPVNALIHCAGIISSRVERTGDGIERNFAVNYLSRYLLTRKLADSIAEDGRVVIVAAAGFFGDHLDFDRLEAEHIPAADAKVFESSQFSNDLWGVELASRSPRWAVSVVQPGLVNTRIRQRSDSAHWYFRLMDFFTRRWGMTPEQGAMTPVYLADEFTGGPERTGRFFGPKRKALKLTRAVGDAARRARLWDASERLVRAWL